MHSRILACLAKVLNNFLIYAVSIEVQSTCSQEYAFLPKCVSEFSQCSFSIFQRTIFNRTQSFDQLVGCLPAFHVEGPTSRCVFSFSYFFSSWLFPTDLFETCRALLLSNLLCRNPLSVVGKSSGTARNANGPNFTPYKLKVAWT